MQCRKCGSTNLGLIDAGPHKKLVCKDCLAFQKLLKKGEAKTFLQLQQQKEQ